MASTINASNTGAGGLVYTADSSGALVLQAAGVTVVTANSTALAVANTSCMIYGGVTLANTVTGTGSMVLSTAPTLIATTLSGNSSAIGAILTSASENINVTSTAANGTINYDINSQNVLYFTANSTGNWTVNFRGTSGTTLNNTLATGQAVTAAHLVSQGTTAYYNNLVQVDGANTTAKWQGGSSPTAGNANSVDGYIYTIMKTANATFSVFAGQVQYK